MLQIIIDEDMPEHVHVCHSDFTLRYRIRIPPNEREIVKKWFAKAAKFADLKGRKKHG